MLQFIPLCSSVPWTEGTEEYCFDYNVSWFSNQANVDNNIVSLRHALELVGSKRITMLHTTEKDDSDWSLYLINRHEVRTSCVILKE